MGQLLLFVVVALVVAAIVFGVTVMLGGGDSGLTPVEPDGRALPLPSDRPLGEEDIIRTRFDTAFRGYRMAQVDQALQRAAYDVGYKGELIGVLEAEVLALREGRIADADVLRRAREAAIAPPVAAEAPDDAPVASVPIEVEPAPASVELASVEPAVTGPAALEPAALEPAALEPAAVDPERADAEPGAGEQGKAKDGESVEPR
jgi:DivIVA domain-containing protein